MMWTEGRRLIVSRSLRQSKQSMKVWTIMKRKTAIKRWHLLAKTIRVEYAMHQLLPNHVLDSGCDGLTEDYWFRDTAYEHINQLSTDEEPTPKRAARRNQKVFRPKNDIILHQKIELISFFGQNLKHF